MGCMGKFGMGYFRLKKKIEEKNLVNGGIYVGIFEFMIDMHGNINIYLKFEHSLKKNELNSKNGEGTQKRST